MATQQRRQVPDLVIGCKYHITHSLLTTFWKSNQMSSTTLESSTSVDRNVGIWASKSNKWKHLHSKQSNNIIVNEVFFNPKSCIHSLSVTIRSLSVSVIISYCYILHCQALRARSHKMNMPSKERLDSRGVTKFQEHQSIDETNARTLSRKEEKVPPLTLLNLEVLWDTFLASWKDAELARTWTGNGKSCFAFFANLSWTDNSAFVLQVQVCRIHTDEEGLK